MYLSGVQRHWVWRLMQILPCRSLVCSAWVFGCDMADLLSEIPLDLMNPAKKYAVINYLVDLGLPARIARQILQQWGDSLNVTIDPGDYALIDNHFKTVPRGS